jgi:hypothetical protein
MRPSGADSERSCELRKPYDSELDRRAMAFQQRYHAFIGVPARTLYRKHSKVG